MTGHQSLCDNTMEKVAKYIIEKKISSDSLAIFWLGQAGFVFKTPDGKIIYIDPYLSDCVDRAHGFKRLMSTVIEPGEVTADFIISTHQHLDHLDIDTIPIIAKNSKAKFIGPSPCMEKCLELGVDKKRLIEIKCGDEIKLGNIRLIGVFADHGELDPEAIGMVLDFQFTRVYVTGDTAYSPDKMGKVISLKPEIIIPVINGAFGNMNPEEAALLTRDVHAKVAIPCHFWMFAEQNGDPMAFIEACKKYAPNATPVLISQGKEYIYQTS